MLLPVVSYSTTGTRITEIATKGEVGRRRLTETEWPGVARNSPTEEVGKGE
jgi:ABC-type phosphonate transport system ATPase subunit